MIKYRVWDTVAKEYLDESAVSINGHGGLAVFDGANIPVATQLPGSTSPRFIIEQCTGLKDKNGVEIAEGDIIECVDKGLEDTEVERDAVSDLTNILSILYKMGELEVIGNIHENAELLEEK